MWLRTNVQGQPRKKPDKYSTDYLLRAGEGVEGQSALIGLE